MSSIVERPSTRTQSLVAAAEASTEAAQRLAQAHDVGDSLAALVFELHAITLTVEAALAPAEQPHADKPAVEEGWYEIELMGRRTRHGYLRAVTFAGRRLVEITEPEHPVQPTRGDDDDPETKPARVEWYSPTAIFSLALSTETDAINDLAERSYRPF